MTTCGLPSLNFPAQVKALKLLKHDFAILSFISNENTLKIGYFSKESKLISIPFITFCVV